MWVDVFFKNEGLRENYSLRAASEPCRKEVYESRSMAEDDKLINILPAAIFWRNVTDTVYGGDNLNGEEVPF